MHVSKWQNVVLYGKDVYCRDCDSDSLTLLYIYFCLLADSHKVKIEIACDGWFDF